MPWFGPVVTMLLSGSPAHAPHDCLAPLAWSESSSSRATDELLPLVVVLHGRGQEARDLEWLGRDLAAARVVFLEGPIPQRDGRAWFTRRLRHLEPRARQRQLAERREEVALTVQRIAACRPTRGRPILVGYSQGASVALAVAWAYPELTGDVVAVAAYLDPSLEAASAPRETGLRFVHGAADRRLPARPVRKTARHLRRSGVAVRWHPVSNSGHALDRGLRQGLRAELTQAVSASGSS